MHHVVLQLDDEQRGLRGIESERHGREASQQLASRCKGSSARAAQRVVRPRRHVARRIAARGEFVDMRKRGVDSVRALAHRSSARLNPRARGGSSYGRSVERRCDRPQAGLGGMRHGARSDRRRAAARACAVPGRRPELQPAAARLLAAEPGDAGQPEIRHQPGEVHRADDAEPDLREPGVRREVPVVPAGGLARPAERPHRALGLLRRALRLRPGPVRAVGGGHQVPPRSERRLPDQGRHPRPGARGQRARAQRARHLRAPLAGQRSLHELLEGPALPAHRPAGDLVGRGRHDRSARREQPVRHHDRPGRLHRPRRGAHPAVDRARDLRAVHRPGPVLERPARHLHRARHDRHHDLAAADAEREPVLGAAARARNRSSRSSSAAPACGSATRAGACACRP